MNTLQTNYQQLLPDDNEVPHESDIFHVASEGSKSRWNHVGDLDSFFRRLYIYHQSHGLTCIVAEEALRILLCIFIVFGLMIYCTHCIYFKIDDPSSPFANKTDIHLSDLFIPPSACASGFGFWTWLFLTVAVVFILFKIYKWVCSRNAFKEIEEFCESAMKIPKEEMDNLTWHEVQCRLREVQHEQQICVHKSDLTELDIYHRILRNKNFMVAMINKNILPLKYNIKFFGEWMYFTSGLEYNLELLFFGNLLSPFKGTGSLKEEYKKYSKRKEVAAELSRNMFILGVINFVLLPCVLVWQVLSYYVCFSHRIKIEPGFLAARRWSLYSKYYLRHFNELDHELNARLGRAYKPSKDYMTSFSSPLFVIILRFVAYILGSIAVFFGAWAAFQEKLLFVPDYLLIFTFCSAVSFSIWKSMPDENIVYFPDELMQQIVAEVHYVPDHFKTKPHTSVVKDEFCHLFQYVFISQFEELISSIVVPYVLMFPLRHRALDIVDFFRNFTVDVAGVGDVCSFALMDISKHGNQRWSSEAHTKADQYQQAEDGKTELSLIHFKSMNPDWKPPPSSNMYINDLKQQVNELKKQSETGHRNPYSTSLSSLSAMGTKYASLVESIHPSLNQRNIESSSFVRSGMESSRVSMSGGVTKAEGAPYFYDGNFLTGLHGNEIRESINPMEFTAADMSLSALYLHEVHQKNMESACSAEELGQNLNDPENIENEESPLLEIKT